MQRGLCEKEIGVPGRLIRILIMLISVHWYPRLSWYWHLKDNHLKSLEYLGSMSTRLKHWPVIQGQAAFTQIYCVKFVPDRACTLAAIPGSDIQVPYFGIKSLQLIWRSGTSKWNLQAPVPDLQMSSRNWTSWQATRIRADSRFAPSQWETALLCNAVSHWLGTSLESALRIVAPTMASG